MENKTMSQLREEAKKQGKTVPFGATKNDLIKLLQQEVQHSSEENQSSKEDSDVPAELKHLNLVPVKNLTREEVDINRTMSSGRILKVPPHIKRQLDREGYELLFPFTTTDCINRARERGARFVYNKDGSLIKITAKKSNEKGELIYHVAMKIKREILEEEKRQHRERALNLKKGVQSGENDLSEKLYSDDYTKFTIDKKE